MGFFSSIFKAIKSIFSRVLTAISKLFSKVFGSPIVAALAIFVVTWMIVGPAATTFAEFLANPVLYLTASPFLASAAVNLILETIYLIVPEFRTVMAKVFGVMSFVFVALGAWQFLQTGQVFLSAQFLAQHIGTFGLTVAEYTYWFAFVSSLNYMQFTSGMSADPDAEYIKAWLDGFMAIPEVAGDAADSVIGGVVEVASSSLASFLALAAIGYFSWKAFTTPEPAKAEIVFPDQHALDRPALVGTQPQGAAG